MSRLIIGDACDEVASLDPESVHLTLFSPPYDNVRDYDGIWTMNLKRLGQNVLDATVDGGFCAIVMQDGTKDFAKSMTTFDTAVAWRDAGWRLFECVIYSRAGRPGAWWSRRFRVDHEYLLIFLKGRRPRHFDKSSLVIPAKHAGKTWGGTQRLTDGSTVPISGTQAATKCRGTIWHYATSNSEGNKVKTEHPATYPDALARDVIACFTRPGDTVLDPMCGSGTTVVEAVKAGRDAIGVDINEDYIDIARRRLTIEAHENDSASAAS